MTALIRAGTLGYSADGDLWTSLATGTGAEVGATAPGGVTAGYVRHRGQRRPPARGAEVPGVRPGVCVPGLIGIPRRSAHARAGGWLGMPSGVSIPFPGRVEPRPGFDSEAWSSTPAGIVPGAATRASTEGRRRLTEPGLPPRSSASRKRSWRRRARTPAYGAVVGREVGERAQRRDRTRVAAGTLGQGRCRARCRRPSSARSHPGPGSPQGLLAGEPARSECVERPVGVGRAGVAHRGRPAETVGPVGEPSWRRPGRSRG